MINTEKMWDMIGFSFYSFEGIGTLLPIMQEAENPQNFTKLLKLALFTLGMFFTAFGVLAYKYFGDMD